MKKFLVATQYGGLMEDPKFHYGKYQIIEAENAKDAEAKYDRINECSYFYGHCVGEIDESTQAVTVSLDFFLKR